MTPQDVLIAIGFLVISFAALGFGSNLLVSGAATIAKKCNISPLIIGATIIALGTSLPELVISLNAAIHHNPNIAVGNAIGSNIANLTLILGITALFIPLKINKSILRQELPILFLVMLLVGTLILDSNLSRFDGLVLMAGTLALITWLIYKGFKNKTTKSLLEDEFKKEISGKNITTKVTTSWAVTQLIAGMILLPISSHFILQNGITIARYFNISNLVIGLTVMSLGTSLPELSTSLIAARKKAYDIVIGNIIGSNVLNLLAVLSLPSIIRSIELSRHVFMRDYMIMFGFTLVLYAFAFMSNRKARNLNRIEGALLLTGYVAYILTLCLFKHAPPGVYY